MSETRRWEGVDAVIAVGAALASVFITAKIEPSTNEVAVDALGYGCIVVAWGLVAVRRRAPVAALLVASAAIAVYTARDYAGGPVYLAPFLPMYTMASTRERRRSVPLAAAAIGIALIGGLASNLGYIGWTVVYTGWAAATLFLGEAARNQRQYLASLEQRARDLEESREEEARRRVAEERLRIARELHDVVSHSLGSISVQAGVGAHVLDRDPDSARQALLAIKRASRDAMGELRAILGLLRDEGGDAPRTPSPGLADLEALVERSALPVEVVVEGEPYDLPAAADLAAYRIVQESLTNVGRHAGRARARVLLTYGRDAVEIEVTDDGRGVATVNGGGLGLVGMRERAGAVGGTFEAGPRPTGGFAVRATLPREPA